MEIKCTFLIYLNAAPDCDDLKVENRRYGFKGFYECENFRNNLMNLWPQILEKKGSGFEY